MKIVVFDLDETLGYFVEMGVLWDCLNKYITDNNSKNLTQNEFNYLLDLYPEFLRPNIITILKYLKHKKNLNHCDKLMVYTNNQGPKIWATYLINYFEQKINYKLFDQIIAAFKVNGKRIEIDRTTHDKSYNDLIKCTKLPLNAEICFLDDNYYPDMAHDNVYYIYLKPYIHDLPFSTMVDRINQSNPEFIKEKKEDFKTIMMNHFSLYNYTELEKDKKDYELDKIISKEIMYHLETFFHETKPKNKTIKRRTKQKRNKTSKS